MRSPSSWAFAHATATTRSLNECVGIRRVQLQPELAHAERFGQPGCLDERSQAGGSLGSSGVSTGKSAP